MYYFNIAFCTLFVVSKIYLRILSREYIVHHRMNSVLHKFVIFVRIVCIIGCIKLRLHVFRNVHSFMLLHANGPNRVNISEHKILICFKKSVKTMLFTQQYGC